MSRRKPKSHCSDESWSDSGALLFWEKKQKKTKKPLYIYIYVCVFIHSPLGELYSVFHSHYEMLISLNLFKYDYTGLDPSVTIVLFPFCFLLAVFVSAVVTVVGWVLLIVMVLRGVFIYSSLKRLPCV